MSETKVIAGLTRDDTRPLRWLNRLVGGPGEKVHFQGVRFTDDGMMYANNGFIIGFVPAPFRLADELTGGVWRLTIDGARVIAERVADADDWPSIDDILPTTGPILRIGISKKMLRYVTQMPGGDEQTVFTFYGPEAPVRVENGVGATAWFMPVSRPLDNEAKEINERTGAALAALEKKQ